MSLREKGFQRNKQKVKRSNDAFYFSRGIHFQRNNHKKKKKTIKITKGGQRVSNESMETYVTSGECTVLASPILSQSLRLLWASECISQLSESPSFWLILFLIAFFLAWLTRIDDHAAILICTIWFPDMPMIFGHYWSELPMRTTAQGSDSLTTPSHTLGGTYARWF
jgi:hypothetical protein